jgi:hypothetical protein
MKLDVIMCASVYCPPFHTGFLYSISDAAARLQPKYEEMLKLSITSVETAWKYVNVSDQVSSVCFNASGELLCIGGVHAQARAAATGTLFCWTRTLPGSVAQFLCCADVYDMFVS